MIMVIFIWGGNINRFNIIISTIKIKEIIESGKLGEIKIIKAHYGFRAIKSDRKWIFSREFAGGGPIFDIGVHIIDLVRYLTSNHKLLSFKGMSQSFNIKKYPDRDVESSGQIIMKFEGGIHAEVSCSFNTPYLTSLEIIGTEGFLETKYFTLVNRDAEITLFSEKDLGESKEIINVNNGNFYKEEIDDFIQYIQNDDFKPSFPGLKEGILNQIIINNWNVGLNDRQIEEILEHIGGI
jgi:predicted dehydrogenase